MRAPDCVNLVTFETALTRFSTQTGSNPARLYRSQSLLDPSPLTGCWKTLSTLPLAPFLARKGVEVVSEGHPHPSQEGRQRGFAPLHTPFFINLLDFTSHSYDYIALFVSCFDITVGLGSLFQRMAPIYDRLHLSRLNKLFEEN